MSKHEENKPEIRYVPIDMMPNMHDDEDEIDLFELIKTVWGGRMLIVKTVAVFIVLGLVVAFGSAEEYSSQVRVMPEYLAQDQMRLSGGLGGLARQFGVSGGSSQTYDAIPPRMYPDVTQSIVFMRELLNQEVDLPGHPGETVTVETYFREHYSPPFLSYLQRYTIYLPFTVLRGVRSLFRSDDEQAMTVMDRQLADDSQTERIVRMSSDEWQMVRLLRGRIDAQFSQDNSAVTITAKMPDPVIAAEVADHVVQMLRQYITDYRTEKTQRDLRFIEERYEEAEARFEEAQQELARFNDENRGQLTAMARTQEQLLQSRYNLTFNLYNGMAERLEETRIKLQEETPVLNIMDPAAVPDQRSEPRRGMILIIYTMIGGLLGVGLIFGIKFWKSLEEKQIFT